mgnify:CR=1 FL=1
MSKTNLNLYRYQNLIAKEHIALMNDENYEKHLPHIQLLREEEKKILSRITPKQAFDYFHYFQQLFQTKQDYNIEFDLLTNENHQKLFPYQRLYIELLTILAEDEQYFVENEDDYDFLFSYLFTNFVPPGLEIDDLVLYRLDHVERLIGLLEDAKEMKVANEFQQQLLFLYPELMDEMILKNQKITRTSAKISATRFDTSCKFYHQYEPFYSDQKMLLAENPIYYTTLLLSNITDQDLEKRTYQNQAMLAKCYLASFIETLNPIQSDILAEEMFSSLYDEKPNRFNDTNKIIIEMIQDVFDRSKPPKVKKLF